MKNKLNEDQARIIILQLLLILKLFHSKEIVHGNLIPEKVMLKNNSSLEICLSDFSHAIITSNKTTTTQSEKLYYEISSPELSNTCNLSTYHAPEVVAE